MKSLITKRLRLSNSKKPNDDLFNIHLGLYLKKYQKLEKQGLIEINLQPENGLEYDCKLTPKGAEILDEISNLESEWEEFVGITDDEEHVLKYSDKHAENLKMADSETIFALV